MRRLVLSFVLALQVSCAALVGGCGSTEPIPACTDVDWIGRHDHAQLAGAPTFSATRIAPGDPLTLAVPVDVNTRSVRMLIHSVDPDVDRSGGVAETNGGEIIEIVVEDTNLAPGAYLVTTLILDGESEELQQVAVYETRDAELPYVLSTSLVPEVSDECLTDIAAPTFTVVADASGEP